MIPSTESVDAAFQKLIESLAAEAEDLRRIGGEVFHSGAPVESQRLLRRANDRTALREDIVRLYDEWKSGRTRQPPAAPVQMSARELKAERAQPGLIRNIAGMSVQEAARRLDTKPATVTAWLESGKLEGYQRVSGSWKITQAALVKFSREHRDLK